MGENNTRIFALATDPVYIGTGGYTIGRVDNTIVRDTITKIPKIPGSSLAGTWRYYMTLELQGFLKEKLEKKTFKDILNINNFDKQDLRYIVNRWADDKLKDNGESNKFNQRVQKFIELSNTLNTNANDWQFYWGNLISSIKCAGQDDRPNENYESFNSNPNIKEVGHCGHCIVCKTFGFSKNDKSKQGMVFFSDLNILFFPVYTRLGVRWITSPNILEFAGFKVKVKPKENSIIMMENLNSLNLGWINLFIEKQNNFINLSQIDKSITELLSSKLILVSDDLISQIINSNLEVRTSVSIDPLTGAAKEGALFTSEAIPRGTVFYGDIRMMNRINDELLPYAFIQKALEDSKKYYQTFGIGGMVTRGYGRLQVYLSEDSRGENDVK